MKNINPSYLDGLSDLVFITEIVTMILLVGAISFAYLVAILIPLNLFIIPYWERHSASAIISTFYISRWV